VVRGKCQRVFTEHFAGCGTALEVGDDLG
jgi:hypothetical protein